MSSRAWGASAAILIQCLTLWLFLAPGRKVTHAPAGVRSAILMLLPHGAPPKAAPRPAPTAATAPSRNPTGAAAPQRRTSAAPASIAPADNAPEPAPAVPTNATTSALPVNSVPDPFAISQAPTERSAHTIIIQARRDLPHIDKEILGKAKGVPDDRPETLEERLARGIASAYVGKDTAETIHRYTAPDGVGYTRITKGPHTTCYRSRTADFNAVFGTSKTWTPTKCPPANGGWTR